MNGKMIGYTIGALTLVGMIGGGSITAYNVSTGVDVNRTAIVVVDSKANYALEQLINDLVATLTRIKDKANAGTASDYELSRVPELEKELARLRKLRYGK